MWTDSNINSESDSEIATKAFYKWFSALNSASFALSFDTSLNCNRVYLTLLIFKTNTFFQIWQQCLCSANLKLVWLETSFRQEFITKNRIWFNVHAPLESFIKVRQLEEKSFPKQREFSSSNWHHIFFSYLW